MFVVVPGRGSDRAFEVRRVALETTDCGTPSLSAMRRKSQPSHNQEKSNAADHRVSSRTPMNDAAHDVEWNTNIMKNSQTSPSPSAIVAKSEPKGPVRQISKDFVE